MGVIYTSQTQEPRFVESHICQHRADMGHTSFVTVQAVRNGLRSVTSDHDRLLA